MATSPTRRHGGRAAAPTSTSAQPPEPAVTDTTSVEIPARAWRALAVGSAGFSLVSFNTTATNLAFGDISDTFSSASAATVSWVASIFFIGMASLLLVSGRLADRTGRRRVFRAGLATFAVGALLSAFAPTVYVLILARLVASAGGALIIPSSLAVVLPEFPRERHFTAVSLWAATGPLASAIAPGAAALILAASSWRVLFAVSAPIALAALLIGWSVLGESRAERRSGPLDLIGVVIGTAAIAALVFAASQGGNLGWDSPLVIGALLIGATALPLFLRRCRRHPEPLLNLDTFLLPPVWLANVANFLLNLAGMATWLVWPLFMERVWGFSTLQTGLGLMPGPVLSGVITSAGPRISERRGHETLVRWGSFVPILAMVWPLLFLTETPNYWIGCAPAIALFGAGWALTQPPLNSGVMAQVHPDAFGEVNAAFNTVRNIAGALGIALAIAILGDTSTASLDAYEHVFLFFTVAVVACWLVLFFVYPRVSRRYAESHRGMLHG